MNEMTHPLSDQLQIPEPNKMLLSIIGKVFPVLKSSEKSIVDSEPKASTILSHYVREEITQIIKDTVGDDDLYAYLETRINVEDDPDKLNAFQLAAVNHNKFGALDQRLKKFVNRLLSTFKCLETTSGYYTSSGQAVAHVKKCNHSLCPRCQKNGDSIITQFSLKLGKFCAVINAKDPQYKWDTDYRAIGNAGLSYARLALEDQHLLILDNAPTKEMAQRISYFEFRIDERENIEISGKLNPDTMKVEKLDAPNIVVKSFDIPKLRAHGTDEAQGLVATGSLSQGVLEAEEIDYGLETKDKEADEQRKPKFKKVATIEVMSSDVPRDIKLAVMENVRNLPKYRDAHITDLDHLHRLHSDMTKEAFMRIEMENKGNHFSYSIRKQLFTDVDMHDWNVYNDQFGGPLSSLAHIPFIGNALRKPKQQQQKLE